MDEPVSWQLLEFLRERLQLIRPVNGYRTALGDGVIALDDSEVPDDSALPLTVIEAQDATPTTTGRRFTGSDLDVLIEFSVPRGAANGTDNPKLLTHRARADLVRALHFHPNELPRFVSSLQITGASLGGVADLKGTSFAIAQVSLRAALIETDLPVTNP